MKKSNLLFLLAPLLTAVILFCICYFEYEDYYRAGHTDTFYVKVGDDIQIRLYENGSTGYLQCWLNKNGKSLVRRDYNKYADRPYNRKKCDGCGTIVTLNFKAIKQGIDTIKTANCPVGVENKEPSDYTDKNTKADNVFIVNISE